MTTATEHLTDRPGADRRRQRRRGVRRADGRRLQRRRLSPAAQHRPPGRALRHHGRSAPVDERSRSPRPRASTSATCASGSAALTTGGVVDYDPAAGTYWLPAEHAACLTAAAGTGQPGPRDAVTCRCWRQVEQHGRRLLPQRRRRALRRFPALPARDGRGQRARSTTPRLLDADPAARRRVCADTTEAGIDVADIGCGRGPRHQPDGPRVPDQPLRRLRLLRGGDRSGARRGAGVGPDQRDVRGRATSRRSTRPSSSTWSPPSTRSTTRPTRPACSPASRRR